MKKTMKIQGMMCPHCEARVKKVLEAIDGVASAVVSHKKGTAVVTLTKEVDDSVLKKAVELLEAELKANGCPKVAVNDLARCDMAEAVEDAFRYGKLVLATTTYNSDVFPFMRNFIHELTERGYKNRKIGIIENGTWSPTAAKVMKKMLEGSKNIEFTDTTVTIHSAVNDSTVESIKALAKEMC